MDNSIAAPPDDLTRLYSLRASFADNAKSLNSVVLGSPITARAAAAASLSLILVMDFIANEFRHGKTSLASGEPDPGILVRAAAQAERAAADFIAALGRHLHPERDASALAP